MTPEEFRRAGHALVDWIADYRENIADLPVQSVVKPGDVRSRFGQSPPSRVDDIDAVLADLSDIVVPGLTQVQHPMHFGWFPSNATLSSVLGDFESSGLGSLGLSWQSAPALTEVEEVVCDWLRQLTGLSEEWSGTIHDTASTACLVAMLAARERATNHSQVRDGLKGFGSPLTVYASAQAHSSVQKAVALAGYGSENLRLVPVDPSTFALRADVLASMINEDIATGFTPAAIVATVGTTATTAVDPVRDVVQVAQQHDVWVHVDAAMAGSAMLLPECRSMWDGVEGADSLTWNPHKWMGAVLDTSLFYVRDVEHTVRVMSTNPSYLRSAVDDEVTQYRDWGIPLGRRFRALKLWFQLRLDGVESIQERLRRDLANAEWFHEQVASAPDWRVIAPVRLQTVCVRHLPPDVPIEDLDTHTLAWADAINRSGRAHVTPAKLDDGWMVRVSVGVEATERSHVAELWELIQEVACNCGCAAHSA